MLFPGRPSHFSHSLCSVLSILFFRRAQIRSSGTHGRSSIRKLVGQQLGMELYGAEEKQQQQQPCCRLSSKKRSGGKGGAGKSGRPSFSGRCARLVKEQRARFYIMRRCVTMLVCWRDYA